MSSTARGGRTAGLTRWVLGAACAAVALGLAGCGKEPEDGARKADAKPWESPAQAHVDGAWKAGDKAAWEEQLRSRAQAQNEYLRTR
jgi:hypothetical protein